MNNLLSYYGLVDAKRRASDKDLPVQEQPEMDGEDEKCNYNYKGDIVVKRNTFGYLRKEVRIFQSGRK